MQAYQRWKAGDADALFVINNDVLVPDGAFSALAYALSPEGILCYARVLSLRRFQPLKGTFTCAPESFAQT